MRDNNTKYNNQSIAMEKNTGKILSIFGVCFLMFAVVNGTADYHKRNNQQSDHLEVCMIGLLLHFLVCNGSESVTNTRQSTVTQNQMDF